MSEFSFETPVEVRYRDLDPLGHVNNAVYATYLESARVEYLRTVLDETLVEGESVLAHVSVDFRRPVTFEDDLRVALRVTGLGESSVDMAYEVRAGDEAAATAETTLVVVEDGRPAPIPEEWRAAIEAFEGGVE